MMNTPLLQASSTQISAVKTQVVNIQDARPSGGADELTASFQLATTDANTPDLALSGSLEETLLLTDEAELVELGLTEMVPVLIGNAQGTVTPGNPQLSDEGAMPLVAPATNSATLAGFSHPVREAAKEVLLKLNETKMDKLLNVTASGNLNPSSSASTSLTESGMLHTTVMGSVGENKSSFPLTASSNDPVSQLSGSQSLKDILPIAMAAQNHSQSGTATTQNAVHFGTPAQVHSTEWASVKVDTSAAKWGEQMMQVLHDRVTLQAQQNMQEAKIRLDPPELGRLNLIVRVEGDTLNVQINANAASTREALVQVSERLRTELQNQNFLNVNVNVGSDDSHQQQAAQQELDEFTIFSARDTSQPDSLSNLSEHWLSTQA